ncbi:hypothetical protein [Blastococcus litoris]|uniref:hypothetical protein n=1 Tax=Blastococcus litoris TaxID=2171622 RepID=UPI000E3025F8|nr:hypothetical protein [Blastococcus litoris]
MTDTEARPRPSPDEPPARPQRGATGTTRRHAVLRWCRHQGLLLLTFLLAAAPIVYVGFREFDIDDPATGGDDGDSAAYARMALTGDLDGIEKPFRYRVVVPFLAHVWLHLGERPEAGDVQATFAVLNMIGLALAAWAMCNFLRRFGFSAQEGFTGALLFLATWPVLRFGGVVLTDAWSHAVLAGAAYAIVARKHRLLLVVATVGMFVRETTVIAVLLVLVVAAPRATRLRQLACFVPGVLGYLLFRFVLAPTTDGYAYNLDRMERQLVDVSSASGLPSTLRELALTFGATGLLLVVGLVRNRRLGALPRNLYWLIPVAFVIPFLIASNLARVWFLAFPAAIPLALLGLRAVLGEERAPADRPT